jgi:nucleotide-binding universal stress UspA family protein
MKTLLVPLDFSRTTERVLRHAAELAHSFGARLFLLHIVEPVATYVPMGASMDVIAAAPPPATETQDLSAAETKLQTLAEPLVAAGIEVECHALVGLAVDDIVEQAEKRAVDFIVLGSHGHGALYHLFSGSVVNGVLKRAKCPVIVIPAAKK